MDDLAFVWMNIIYFLSVFNQTRRMFELSHLCCGNYIKIAVYVALVHYKPQDQRSVLYNNILTDLTVVCEKCFLDYMK